MITVYGTDVDAYKPNTHRVYTVVCDTGREINMNSLIVDSDTTKNATKIATTTMMKKMTKMAAGEHLDWVIHTKYIQHS